MCTTPAGGPSTINGVLYQMLWCLFRAARLHISNCTSDQNTREIMQATLRLEPSGGGGDLQEITGDRKVVAQLKARSDQGTWSLREVVEEILPDLYLAIEPGFTNVEYQVITEGRIGGWPRAYSFFQSLRTRPVPSGVILDALDDTAPIPFRGAKGRGGAFDDSKIPFWPDRDYTERTLFQRIVEEVRRRLTSAAREEPLETTQQNVWNLLADFTFIGDQTKDNLRRQVDALLLALVNFDTEIGEKRDAMLLALACHAARGSADLDSTRFLAEYGLDSVPLTNWLLLRERGRLHLEDEVTRRGYQSSEDVRKDLPTQVMTQWPQSSPMLVLSGESGQGKSWLLYSLAKRLMTDRELVLLTEATGDANDDLADVASVFWRAIKHNDTGPGLDRIADRRRRLIHERADRWLTVLIDGVEEPKEIRALALMPWEDWGVRLLVTAQPELARMLEKVAHGRAALYEVDDFTVPQLQLFLSDRFGDDWANVPSDVRDILRRPLLAQLYCGVIRDRNWRPTSEYELYAAYWKRLREDEQILHALDAVGLQRLAMSLLEGAAYPWAPEQLAKADLDSATVSRLVRLGFLRQTANGRYEVWHDRILNWAVAQGMVARLRAKEIDAQEFSKQLHGLFKSHQTYSGKFLGYVPMDVIWTIADPEAGLPSELEQVVEALEQAGWQEAEVLYDHLLPTVGPRIAPTLFRRLAAISNRGDVVLENRIIGAIASFSEQDVADHTADLLSKGGPWAKRAALKVLAKRPNPQLLDEVWKLQCQMRADPKDFLREHDWKELLDSECFDALAAGVRCDRKWLESAIKKADRSQEPVHVLAYLVATLGNEADIWQAHKRTLFSKVLPEKARALASNIYVYRDGDEVEWLINQLGRADDLIGATALRALIRINPDLALEHLDKLPERELCLTRHWCFAELLARRPEATLSRIHQMMRVHPRPRDLGQVFQGQENALDDRSLDTLLDDLESVLENELSGQRDPNRGELWSLCELLAKANCLPHLKRFWNRQGTAMEENLTSWLLKRGWFSGPYVDSESRAALDVLYKFGGEGFTRVLNTYLDSGDRFGCLRGTELGMKRPNDVTIEKLIRVSLQDELWEGKRPVVQGYAAKALAALGRQKEVVDSIVKWGLHTLSVVTDHRVGGGDIQNGVVETCVKAISGVADPPAGAVMAIGVFGSAEHMAGVRRVLANAVPKSETAKAAVIALGLLRDQSYEAVELIQEHMAVLDHPHVALVALSRIGTDRAKQALLKHLESHYQVELAADLLDSPVTREQAAELTRRYLSTAEPFYWAQAVERLVRYVGDDRQLFSLVDEARLLEYLYGVAFAEEGRGWFVGSKANVILGLSRFDPKAAYLAALSALRNPSCHDREYYPYILIDIDAAKAVSALLWQATEEKSTEVVWAIGRALASLDDFTVIQEWLLDTDPRKRLAACRTCERLSPMPQVLQAIQPCLDDEDLHVAEAARGAVWRLHLALETERLVEAILVEPDNSKRWVFVDAVLAVGDPGDKHRPLPDWARRIRDGLPYFMRVYLCEKLERQREETVREAEKRDK